MSGPRIDRVTYAARRERIAAHLAKHVPIKKIAELENLAVGTVRRYMRDWGMPPPRPHTAQTCAICERTFTTAANFECHRIKKNQRRARCRTENELARRGFVETPRGWLIRWPLPAKSLPSSSSPLSPASPELRP